MRRALGGAGLLLLTAAAQADQAIVVGINKYRDPRPHVLKGPQNDAADMAAFCRSNGYALTDNHFLLGEKATKQAVMAALKDLEGSVKEGEKVIFFFAGHGGNRNPGGKPDCFLLPYDYADDKPGATIGVDELYAAMKRLKTKANRTVILDSCFSGGMARDLDFTSRSYAPFGSRSVVPVAPDEGQTQAGVPAKTPDGPPDKDKICYLTAAKATEQALETEIGGKDHGLFTKALLPELAKGETCDQTAANVRTSIAKLIASKKSTRKQTPDVTDEYRNLVALKDSPSSIAAPPPPPPPPKAVWDLLAKERPDAKKLSITVEPNRTNTLIGQTVRLKVKVGAPGYLVVVWSKDKMELKVPGRSPSGTYDPVKVEAGKEYPLYAGAGQTFTQPAGNRVTALLFESPGPAQALVDSLTGAKPPTIDELEARGLIDVGGSKEYTTTAVSFEAGAELPGGFAVADAPGLMAALSKGGYKDALDNNADSRILAYLRTDGEAGKNPKAYAAYLTVALNMALEALAAQKEVFVGSDEPGLTPEQVRLVKDAEKKMASASKDEAALLNATLLASLMKGKIAEVKA